LAGTLLLEFIIDVKPYEFLSVVPVNCYVGTTLFQLNFLYRSELFDVDCEISANNIFK
jgi:hypothetical protein